MDIMLTLKEIQEAEQELEENDGLHNKEMDDCIRASSLLYARLFESRERVHMADKRPTT